ncbi:ATR-interacting protein [Brachyhypopomus gauderio]|uniref:ATR-interacting protein n=1 Tax=Brachyhypopomus gauderio TaxID=698409 RepID=UPI00404297C0
MEFPPSKRLKGSQNEEALRKDPFEDEDFTQDDLEEIDIIASQAITASTSKRTFEYISSYSREQHDATVRADRRTFSIGNNQPGGSNATCNLSRQSSGAFGNAEGRKDRDDLCYSRLEAQHAELKKKLKEVEDQILMKNGEIRVLRDSLKQANQEKEQQRQASHTVERQRALIQSEKEKELSKRVESLQSELHFKEAEMNEMRNKLQSSDHSARQVSTPGRNSINSPGSHAFVTKETFSAELSIRSAAEDGRPNQPKNDREAINTDAALNLDFLQKGPVLLHLLLQYPLKPSSLGLCHLLCLSPEALPGLLSQPNDPSPVSSSASSPSSTESGTLHQPQAGFSQLQSLALSGLSTLGSAGPLPAQTYPAAVHLLPLLAYHMNLYCQTLESLERSGPLGGSSPSTSSGRSSASTAHDSLGTQEEFALAASAALNHLASQSGEVACALLCGPEGGALGKAGEGGRGPGRAQPSSGHGTGSGKASGGPTSQHSLLKMLFQLADPKFVSCAGHREALVSCSLRTLCVLAERAEQDQLWRLKVVISQVLPQTLSLESPYKIVCLSVKFLSLVLDCDEMAIKLCSHNYDVCPLLRVFQYVTSTPDKSFTEDMWTCLEVEVIRLLVKLFTQRASTWPALLGESSCPCSGEVVRTAVVVLHRQWLRVKGQERRMSGGGPAWMAGGLHLLREALMLLHWLLLNDSAFSTHCLEVLHMYHQVVPAIRETLRKIPDLSESEELALEEICRPETEDVEDMDIDTGS